MKAFIVLGIVMSISIIFLALIYPSEQKRVEEEQAQWEVIYDDGKWTIYRSEKTFYPELSGNTFNAESIFKICHLASFYHIGAGVTTECKILNIEIPVTLVPDYSGWRN